MKKYSISFEIIKVCCVIFSIVTFNAVKAQPAYSGQELASCSAVFFMSGSKIVDLSPETAQVYLDASKNFANLAKDKLGSASLQKKYTDTEIGNFLDVKKFRPAEYDGYLIRKFESCVAVMKNLNSKKN